ncbi:MAG: Sapep family Mn(2+)-dependent dipeptidase [Enterocloster asparagiformis]|nr:Sapep family Mn(2+)-dependent dipeptidase [Enterocloster asparagiformis]
MGEQAADGVRTFLLSHREDMVEDLVRLVKIQSLRSGSLPEARYGRAVRSVLEAACGILREAGFSAGVEPDGAFAICDWGDGDSILGIAPHLDVVSAEGGWSAPPFEPVLQGDFLVGRGVSDDKGGAVMAIWALRALRECGFTPEGKVRLFLGGNEETGMEDIRLLEARYGLPDFSLVPDAFFAVGVGQKGRGVMRMGMKGALREIKDLEGGGKTAGAVPSRASCTLPDNEKLQEELESLCRANGRLSYRAVEDGYQLCAEGVSAHTAMPQGSVNAVWVLADALGRLAHLDCGDRAAMQELARLIEGYDGNGMGISARDERSGDLTCVAVYLGSEGGRLQADCNIRFPVSVAGDELEERVKARLGGCAFWEMEEFGWNDPYYLPPDRPEIELLRKVYRECTGSPADLYVHPGGTYAKELGNAVIFGNEFRKEIPFPEGRGRAHQADEAVSISDLLEGTYIYAEAIQSLDRHLADRRKAV